MEYVVGVDIGGTFTDCVAMDGEGILTVGKALSTPEDFSLGALNAVADTAMNLGLSGAGELLRSTRHFFHACTIGENTLITRSGARTGLIATKGFADTMLMMRGRTTDGLTEAEVFHVSAQNKPDPLVPRMLIHEVTERVDYKGAILIALDTDETEDVIDRLVSQGVESVAVCLLWSTANDVHERAVKGILATRHPSVFLSLSSAVAPFLGEYERTATTVFNAYIGPRIRAYLQRLDGVLRKSGLAREPLVMQAYGGVLGIEASCENAVGTIESGPAAGVVGSQSVGALMRMPNILATDMGGTTFKVSVIRDGTIERDYKPVMLQYQLFSTKIWVESIGAGGGSIAWIDPETRLLKVGPRGAGARPGPVSYGFGGTEPTVSDADLVLGYLNPEYFLGGRMKLHKEKAVRAIDAVVARPLNMSTMEAASGIYRITNAHMSDLIRKATVERGYDPRDFTLFAYGGAAAVHAGRYAAELGIKHVVVPLTASVHGATGLIRSDVTYEYGKSEPLTVPAPIERVNAIFGDLTRQALADLRGAGFADNAIRLRRSVDMRYRYQVHELNVPCPDGLSEITSEEMQAVYDRFDVVYEEHYGQGSAFRDDGRQVINFRISAVGELSRPEVKVQPLSSSSRQSAVARGTRQAFFEELCGSVATPIYDFRSLVPGDEITGPSIIETPVTTIVVNPTDVAYMDELRNVRLLIGGSLSGSEGQP